VQAIVVANVASFGERMSMTVKMLGVETAEILWIGSGSARTGEMLATLGGAALGGAAGVAAGGSPGGRLAGGIGGAIVGGAIGHELSPQELTVAQKMIKATCENLPVRGFVGGG
jgi:outer membrane lipoprotein SlyB